MSSDFYFFNPEILIFPTIWCDGEVQRWKFHWFWAVWSFHEKNEKWKSWKINIFWGFRTIWKRSSNSWGQNTSIYKVWGQSERIGNILKFWKFWYFAGGALEGYYILYIDVIIVIRGGSGGGQRPPDFFSWKFQHFSNSLRLASNFVYRHILTSGVGWARPNCPKSSKNIDFSWFSFFNFSWKLQTLQNQWNFHR